MRGTTGASLGSFPTQVRPVSTQKKIYEKFCAIGFEKLEHVDAQGHICNALEGSPPGGLPGR